MDRMMNDPDTKDRLEKAFGNLMDMTPDELRARIVQIRSERRLIKAKRADKKNVKVTSDTAKTRMRKMLSGMDPAEVAKMMKELGG